MPNSRPVMVGLAVVVAVMAGMPRATIVQAQKKDEKKMQDWERKELQSLFTLLDYAMTSQAPDGLSSWTVDPSKKEGGVAKGATAPPEPKWHNDVLKSNDGKTYVPFMLVLPQGTLPSSSLAIALRVVPKGSAAIAKDKDKTEYPWEEFAFTQARSAPVGKAEMISRVFQVGGGDYDVYFAVRAHASSKGKEQPFPALLYKRTMTLPDLTAAELTTSSVMALIKMEQFTGQMTPDLQKERPYVMGAMELVPSLDGQFKKTDNLGVFFQVYNPTLEAGKPDVTIEYSFHRKTPEGEKYFNKTQPQVFSPQTLPPNWDGNAGNLITGGQEVPLASFELGDYRLEIKITDKKASKTITRDVLFTIAS